MKRCPDCGFRVKEDIRDCPLCGVRMLRDSDEQNVTYVSHKHGKDEMCLLPNPTEEAARLHRETAKKHTQKKPGVSKNSIMIWLDQTKGGKWVTVLILFILYIILNSCEV